MHSEWGQDLHIHAYLGIEKVNSWHNYLCTIL
jgi:hypothetical protein